MNGPYVFTEDGFGAICDWGFAIGKGEPQCPVKDEADFCYDGHEWGDYFYLCAHHHAIVQRDKLVPMCEDPDCTALRD